MAARVLFSAGQAISPICSTALYTHGGAWLPWAVQAALIAATLASYPLLGVALFREPEWRTAADAAAAMPVDVAVVTTEAAATAADEEDAVAAPAAAAAAGE